MARGICQGFGIDKDTADDQNQHNDKHQNRHQERETKQQMRQSTMLYSRFMPY